VLKRYFEILLENVGREYIQANIMMYINFNLGSLIKLVVLIKNPNRHWDTFRSLKFPPMPFK
jgi:hypothetical protein